MNPAQNMKYIQNLQSVLLHAKHDPAQGAYLEQNIAYIQKLERDIYCAVHPQKYKGEQTLRKFS